MKNIFISYAHQDYEAVDELVSNLNEVLISGWRDKADLVAGEAISSVLKNSLKKASAILVIISPFSLKSKWLDFEVSAGVALGKIIIPVIISGEGIENELPESISDIMYIDGRDKSLVEIVSEIKNGLEQEPRPSFSQRYINGFSRTAIPKEVVMKSLSEPTSSQYFYHGRPCTRNIASFSIKVKKFSGSKSDDGYSSITLQSYGDNRSLNSIVWGIKMYQRDIPHDPNVEPILLLNIFLNKYGILQNIGAFDEKLLYQGESLQVPLHINSKEKAGLYLSKIRGHENFEKEEEYEYLVLYEYEKDRRIVVVDFSFTICISKYRRSLEEKGLWQR